MNYECDQFCRNLVETDRPVGRCFYPSDDNSIVDNSDRQNSGSDRTKHSDSPQGPFGPSFGRFTEPTADQKCGRRKQRENITDEFGPACGEDHEYYNDPDLQQG